MAWSIKLLDSLVEVEITFFISLIILFRSSSFSSIVTSFLPVTSFSLSSAILARVSLLKLTELDTAERALPSKKTKKYPRLIARTDIHTVHEIVCTTFFIRILYQENTIKHCGIFSKISYYLVT